MKQRRKRTYYKDEEILREIGGKIRSIRNAKKISLETLANDYDLDYSQLNRMELGKVNFNISYLYRVAKALDVHPRDLLS